MALNNLSYYDDPQSFIIRHADTLAQREKRRFSTGKSFSFLLVLIKYIRNDDKMDCVIEAFRVLGNLSRSRRVRDRMMKCEGWFFFLFVDRISFFLSNF